MGTVRYGGVDLSGFGAGYVTLDGVKGAPPVRGANVLIPYQHGQRWVPKYYDERPVVIQGIIKAATQVALDSSIDSLKALFPIGAGEQKLEVQQADGTWRYTMAEVRNLISQVDISNVGLAAKWSLELVASDPFWYGSALEASQARQAWALDSGVNLDDGAHWLDQTSQFFAQVITTRPATIEASNAGTTYNRKPVFTLTGIYQSPKITNLRNGYSIQVPAGPVYPGVLVIDCGAQVVTQNGQPVAPSLILLGPGQSDWMRLEAGENSLVIDVGVNAPVVTYGAQYSPSYL